MKTNNNPVKQKYAGITEAGRVAYQQGSVKPFGGFPESLKKRVNLSFSFDRQSAERIWASDLELVSQHCSFTFLVAGRDFPLHATLLEGEDSLEVSIFSKAIQELQIELSENLLGREVVFDRFIADASGSIILAVTKIPRCVLEARKLVAKCYESEKLKVLPLENILHSTQVRVTRFPSDARMLSIFHREVEEINTRLEKRPINARMEAVSIAQAYAFLRSKP